LTIVILLLLTAAKNRRKGGTKSEFNTRIARVVDESFVVGCTGKSSDVQSSKLVNVAHYSILLLPIFEAVLENA
jgi:hypothetical protein